MWILVADDHEIMRTAVKLKLQTSFPRARFIESACYESTLSVLQASQKEPEPLAAAVIDLHMPGMSGLASIDHFIVAGGDTPIAIFSNEQNTAYMLDILNRGVRGFIPKQQATAVVVKAIELIMAGGTYIPEAVLMPLTIPSPAITNHEVPLTARQRELIRYICAGYPNKRIASQMNLSPGTVKQYVHRLYQQLAVSSRVELQNRVRKSDLVQPRERED